MKLARAALIALAISPVGHAFAEHSGSMDDQIACTPDVYRLCSSKIPDEDAIVACLQKNKAALSVACRKVFSEPSSDDGSQQDQTQ